jgi:hypothetical protein
MSRAGRAAVAAAAKKRWRLIKAGKIRKPKVGRKAGGRNSAKLSIKSSGQSGLKETVKALKQLGAAAGCRVEVTLVPK